MFKNKLPLLLTFLLSKLRYRLIQQSCEISSADYGGQNKNNEHHDFNVSTGVNWFQSLL